MLSPKRHTFISRPSARAAAARIQASTPRRGRRDLPSAHNDFPFEPQPAADESEFPAAMGGLVEVHEVHIDGAQGISRLYWVWS